VLATLDVDQPRYMHSFGMTARYVILAEWPLVVDPLDLLLRGEPFIENFDWEPGRGTRFRVLRKADGEEVATGTADAAFAFHHVNAFERGGEIVCDIVTYPDASIIDALYLDRLRGDEPTPGTGRLRRYRLPLNGGAVSSTVQSDERLELPRLHETAARAQSYQFVYGVGERGKGTFTDQLVKIDVETGDARMWRESGTYPGEPVFVPRPGGTGEDDGVVLSVVLDPEAERSFLLVLDAASFAERARAAVPHAIPFGFHGQFFD
jgi:carotenoid cleavage dioxygenase-like enzyme